MDNAKNCFTHLFIGVKLFVCTNGVENMKIRSLTKEETKTCMRALASVKAAQPFIL